MSTQEHPARVVECFGRRLIVETADGQRIAAEMFGKRLSCVCGDEVIIRTASDAGDVPRVIEVKARSTSFARADSRGRTEPLASNLTLLATILAPEPEPDPYITDRYLAGAALAGIASMVIVNKSELQSARDQRFVDIVDEYRAAGFDVVTLTAQDPATVEPLKARLQSNVTMLVGQSGVGKSTLTNQLVPESARATRTLSDSSREGRHTTVSTALFRLSTGGELIDSPGVRDYAPPLVEDATIQVGWPEILRLAPECRFNNCLHLREPGCAVLGAIETGGISARRYESYRRLLNIMRGLAPEYERRK
jgi:ribosome biogenesis GTPase